MERITQKKQANDQDFTDKTKGNGWCKHKHQIFQDIAEYRDFKQNHTENRIMHMLQTEWFANNRGSTQSHHLIKFFVSLACFKVPGVWPRKYFRNACVIPRVCLNGSSSTCWLLSLFKAILGNVNKIYLCILITQAYHLFALIWNKCVNFQSLCLVNPVFRCWQMFALYVCLETEALFTDSGARALGTTCTQRCSVLSRTCTVSTWQSPRASVKVGWRLPKKDTGCSNFLR